MRALPRLGAIAFALLAAACGNPASGPLEQSRSLWKAHPADHHFTFHWSCFCPEDYTNPVRIQVHNDAISAITDIKTGQPVAPARWSQYKTIDGLHDFIQAAIDKSAYQIQATYDPKLGYPLEVSIDYDKNAVDEEMAFSVSEYAAP